MHLLLHYFQVCPFRPLLASVFPLSMQSWRWLPVPTLTCEQRVEAAEVVLVYLPRNFPPYTMHGECKLTILRHLVRENTPPRTYAIQKHKNVPYFFHGLFKNGQHSSRATCGVHEGFVGRAQRIHSSGREWKCSVMVEHGRLVVIRDHLFLSEHKASAFSLRDRCISGSELDRRIKGGHTHQ